MAQRRFALLNHTHGSSGLTDFDFTGASDNDMLYRSGGIWIDTAGALTWDGSNFSATSIGGITEGNLLDKTAAETITEDWIFDGNIDIQGGNTFQIRDSTNVDRLVIIHDGTDVRFSHVGTTSWTFSDLTSILAGTVDADFDAITATSYGGITEANLLDKLCRHRHLPQLLMR